MIRINVFTEAYFQYRDFAPKQFGNGHEQEELLVRNLEENELMKGFDVFQ